MGEVARIAQSRLLNGDLVTFLRRQLLSYKNVIIAKISTADTILRPSHGFYICMARKQVDLMSVHRYCHFVKKK